MNSYRVFLPVPQRATPARRASLFAVLAICLFAVTPLLAAGGELDTTFGTGGIVVQDFGGQDTGLGLVVQPDGKIVMVGGSDAAGSTGFALARYMPDGILDSSFGLGGLVTTPGTLPSHDVGLQSDGKLVVVGSVQDVEVARYNTDGSLDLSFGTDGITTTDIGGGTDWGRAVAVLPDDKIMLGGTSLIAHGGGSNKDFAVVRYNANGSLDTTFGNGGFVTSHFGSNEEITSLALQPDGKLIAAGWSNSIFAVARYNVDGTLDPTFGTGGVATISFRDIDDIDLAFAVALQPDGKIVVAGNSSTLNQNWDFALARLNSDGSLDTSFGVGGKVESDFGGNERIHALAVQSDGNILAAGQTLGGHITLARYLPDGSLDSLFGVGGVLTTPVGDTSLAHAMAFQSSDKLVVGGTTQVTIGEIIDNNFALARYNIATQCYTLTALVNPLDAGRVDVKTAPNCNNGTQYLPDTDVRLIVKQNRGYHFANWSGDVSDTHRRITLPMDSDKIVTANFQ